MKCLIIILGVIILNSYSVTAQTIAQSTQQFSHEKDSAYYATYNKMKELLIVKIFSKEYQVAKAMTLRYKKNLEKSPYWNRSIIAKDEGGLEWLKDNWQSTGFLNYEDAQKEFKAIHEAYREADEKYPEFTDYQLKALLKYGPNIYLDLRMEMLHEYPDIY